MHKRFFKNISIFELAFDIGVSNLTLTNWLHNKKVGPAKSKKIEEYLLEHKLELDIDDDVLKTRLEKFLR